MLDYSRHSRWTEPGAFGVHLDDLPADPSGLPEIVGDVMLHPFFAPTGTDCRDATRRSIPEILDALIQRDGSPLTQRREPSNRVIGTCRNYALLACAILRQHGWPTRLRVGYADYFAPDFWEDHWVCEYRTIDGWRLLDAELTAEIRARLRIAFDPAEVPRDSFLTAGHAWQKLRRGDGDPARFGVSILGIAGLWFVAGSLLRDLAALGGEEMMPWDYWGPARDFGPRRPIPRKWMDRLDDLADDLVALDPDPSALLAKHPWAALTPTVLSFPEGKPIEVSLNHW
jgi:transglutaminase superfamily protein